MEVIYVNIENIKVNQSKKQDCVMVLGYFDGVHLGHQEVISTAKNIAQKISLNYLYYHLDRLH